MIVAKNNFGKDPIENYENDSAKRIGHRIKIIRKANGMTQAELAAKIGLPVDRVAGYERGARKPKFELLKIIANALGVNPLALLDPDNSNWIGVMHSIFEISEHFDLELVESGNNVLIKFKDKTINDSLVYWKTKHEERQNKLKNTVSDEERQAINLEYKNWMWSFPENINTKPEKNNDEVNQESLIEHLGIENVDGSEEIVRELEELIKKIKEINKKNE